MTVAEAGILQWHVPVLIPARNEAELLPRCLRSVLAACQALPTGVSSEIVVVSDKSTDQTSHIAQTMLQRNGAVIESLAGNVGAARALAAEEALLRFTAAGHTNLSRCWLANTDADCEVPQNWLLRQLDIARRGFHAVTGIIDVDSFAEHLPFVEARFRATYKIHGDGSHPHVHGANLGVRADAYRLAGGWERLHTGEDHDLWKRIGACNLSRLTDARLRVLTSGRRAGRAPLGFAAALAAHNESALEDVTA